MTAGNYGKICQDCKPITTVNFSREIDHDGIPPNTEHFVDRTVSVSSYPCNSCAFHRERLRERFAIEIYANNNGNITHDDSIRCADKLIEKLRAK